MDDLIMFKKGVSAKGIGQSRSILMTILLRLLDQLDETTATSSPLKRFPATTFANQEMKQKSSSGDLLPSHRLRLSLD
jgi:hypothetical protein